MAEEKTRRATDGNLAAAFGHVHRSTTGIWDWCERRKVAAHIVMAVTVALTLRIAEWAMDFPYENLIAAKPYSGGEVAMIQAAILGPWGLMQGAMFTFYLKLIGANGNGKTEG